MPWRLQEKPVTLSPTCGRILKITLEGFGSSQTGVMDIVLNCHLDSEKPTVSCGGIASAELSVFLMFPNTVL